MNGKRFWTASLLSASICLGLSAGRAKAEMPSNASELAKTGNEKFDALTAQVRAKGDLPRLLVPTEAQVLESFWDMKALIGSAPYRKADLTPLMGLLEKRTAVMNQYVTFTPNGVSQPDADRNLSVFQDEIFRSTHAMLLIAAATIPALQDMIGKRKPSELNKQATDGVRQVKSGLIGLVNGSMEMITHPGLKPENQALIVNALADSANTLAGGTSVKERAGLTQTAQSVLPSLQPEMQDRLQTFMTALSKKGCEGICLIE